ncbi:stage II sporulation protein M [Geoglobus sp.]
MKSFVIVSLIFVASLVAGYVFSTAHVEESREIVSSTFSGLQFVKDLKHYELFVFIFMNNSLKSFAAMILGIAFGVAPVIFVVLNGVIIGVVVGVISPEFGLYRTAMMLIPHGVLEIPAVLLSCSYGLELGIYAWRRYRGEDVDLSRVLLEYIARFAKLPLPVLLVAALIETYVTPAVAGI